MYSSARAFPSSGADSSRALTRLLSLPLDQIMMRVNLRLDISSGSDILRRLFADFASFVSSGSSVIGVGSM